MREIDRKGKLVLGLVAALVAVGALTACGTPSVPKFVSADGTIPMVEQGGEMLLPGGNKISPKLIGELKGDYSSEVAIGQGFENTSLLTGAEPFTPNQIPSLMLAQSEIRGVAVSALRFYSPEELGEMFKSVDSEYYAKNIDQLGKTWGILLPKSAGLTKIETKVTASRILLLSKNDFEGLISQNGFMRSASVKDGANILTFINNPMGNNPVAEGQMPANVINLVGQIDESAESTRLNLSGLKSLLEIPAGSNAQVLQTNDHIYPVSMVIRRVAGPEFSLEALKTSPDGSAFQVKMISELYGLFRQVYLLPDGKQAMVSPLIEDAIIKTPDGFRIDPYSLTKIQFIPDTMLVPQTDEILEAQRLTLLREFKDTFVLSEMEGYMQRYAGDRFTSDYISQILEPLRSPKLEAVRGTGGVFVNVFVAGQAGFDAYAGIVGDAKIIERSMSFVGANKDKIATGLAVQGNAAKIMKTSYFDPISSVWAIRSGRYDCVDCVDLSKATDKYDKSEWVTILLGQEMTYGGGFGTGYKVANDFQVEARGYREIVNSGVSNFYLDVKLPPQTVGKEWTNMDPKNHPNQKFVTNRYKQDQILTFDMLGSVNTNDSIRAIYFNTSNDPKLPTWYKLSASVGSNNAATIHIETAGMPE
jgi:hypothetical protein